MCLVSLERRLQVEQQSLPAQGLARWRALHHREHLGIECGQRGLNGR
jgi:hypothetical protein